MCSWVIHPDLIKKYFLSRGLEEAESIQEEWKVFFLLFLYRLINVILSSLFYSLNHVQKNLHEWKAHCSCVKAEAMIKENVRGNLCSDEPTHLEIRMLDTFTIFQCSQEENFLFTNFAVWLRFRLPFVLCRCLK